MYASVCLYYAFVQETGNTQMFVFSGGLRTNALEIKRTLIIFTLYYL